MPDFNLGIKLSAVRALIIIAAGIALVESVSIPFWALIAIIVIGTAFIRLSNGYSTYLMLLSAAYLYARSTQPRPVPDEIYQLPQFQGIVIQEPLAEQCITVNLLSPLSGKVIVWLKDSGLDIRYGDVLAIKSRIERFSFPRNPGITDRNYYLLKQGYIGSLSVHSTNIKIISRKAGEPLSTYVIMPLRHYLFAVFKRHLPEKEAGLLLGILLGEKHTLNRETDAALTSTGLWHLFVVSGLHMGIIVGIIYLLLTVLNLRGWTRFIILTLATLVYAILAGWHPASVRAAIMSWTLFLSFPLQRRTTQLTTLAVSGIIILLLNPNSLTHIGTQLSFAATTSIILIIPKLQSLLNKNLLTTRFLRNYTLMPLGISIAAMIGTTPLLAHHFYRFQPLSFLITLVVLPLVTMVIPLGLLVAFVNLLSSSAASIFAHSLQFLLYLIGWLITKLGDMVRPLIVVTGKLPGWTIFYLYGMIILLLNWQRNWIRTAFIIGLLFIPAFTVWMKVFTPPLTRFTFLDLAKGDGVLIEDTLGRRLLIDAGIDTPAALNEFFLSRRIRHLDAVIITHPDKDHYGGLLSLSDDIRVGRLMVPTLSGDSVYNHLIDRMKSAGTIIDTVARGARLTGFGFDLEFCAPDQLTRWLYSHHLIPTNQVSLVNLIRYDTFSLLFTGDCESNSILREIASRTKIHILKSPHHGSKKGNPPELYDFIRPNYVMVMGRYPTPAGLETILPARNINYLNTRKDGGIILTFRKGKLKIFPH